MISLYQFVKKVSVNALPKTVRYRENHCMDKSNTGDVMKLKRLIKYLRASAGRRIAIEVGDDITVFVYIDVAN